MVKSLPDLNMISSVAVLACKLMCMCILYIYIKNSKQLFKNETKMTSSNSSIRTCLNHQNKNTVTVLLQTVL